MIYTESPRRKQITEHVSWGHWYALANIFIAIAISSIYLFSTPVTSSPLSFVYLITTWLGHTSFIAFLGFIILVLPLCYKITNMRALRAISSTLAAVGLALLAFDALVYNQTGFHLSFSSAELLRSETQVRVSAFGWLQWFYLVLLFVIWLMLQLVIANAIYKRLKKIQSFTFTPYVITFFVICFVSSHAIHVWADARLYSPVLKQDNMFPLSYPATAKTLMARYGLLDLDLREQQAELQYQVGNGFKYPPRPVYCSVNDGVKVVVLASLESDDFKNIESLNANSYHLVTQNIAAQFLKQIHYGLPSNMADLTSVAPVMLDLLDAFKVPNHSFMATASNESEFEAFKQTLTSTNSGLYIGVLKAEQLKSLQLSELGEETSIMIIAPTSNNEISSNGGRVRFKLYSNFINTTQASSNEDIAPTVLSAFGCLAEVNRYSTGQALQNPNRNWLVSTKEENLLFLKYPLLTEVAPDGSHKVIDVSTGEEVLSELDTNLLSRSIKHLENFTR